MTRNNEKAEQSHYHLFINGMLISVLTLNIQAFKFIKDLNSRRLNERSKVLLTENLPWIELNSIYFSVKPQPKSFALTFIY